MSTKSNAVSRVDLRTGKTVMEERYISMGFSSGSDSKAILLAVDVDTLQAQWLVITGAMQPDHAGARTRYRGASREAAYAVYAAM